MGVLKELVRDKDLTSEELATSEKVTGDSPNNAGTMSLSKGRCNVARQRAQLWCLKGEANGRSTSGY